jgi:hypothetical protein
LDIPGGRRWFIGINIVPMQPAPRILKGGKMMDYGKLKKIKKDLTEKIESTHKALFATFPIAPYLQKIALIPQIGSYKPKSLEVNAYSQSIVDAYDQNALESYHKLVLINLIFQAEDRLKQKKIPEDIIRLFIGNFNSIIKRIESKHVRQGFYLFSNDKFCKDFAVCRLSMIPAGQQKIHLDGIARRFLFQNGVKQFVEFSAFILLELGGFKPLYQMHTDSYDRDLLAEFNFEGTKRFYLRVAELLKLNPRVKGVFGIGWTNDPQLASISPKLWQGVGYIVDNGAKLFNLGSSESAISGATYVSLKRRQLYEEGEYMPTNYLLVWSRKKLLAWADRL